jgi:hypothetical protein
MTFSQSELNTEIECPEGCTRQQWQAVPDIMLAHIVEAHDYTVPEAEKAVKHALEMAYDDRQKFNDWYAKYRRTE